MAVRIGTGLSTTPEPRAAAFEAAAAAADELGGLDCDLALVFVSGAFLDGPGGWCSSRSTRCWRRASSSAAARAA